MMKIEKKGRKKETNDQISIRLIFSDDVLPVSEVEEEFPRDLEHSRKNFVRWLR